MTRTCGDDEKKRIAWIKRRLSRFPAADVAEWIERCGWGPEEDDDELDLGSGNSDNEPDYEGESSDSD
jgi:hypothetical protein